jgi:hypothetical protein
MESGVIVAGIGMAHNLLEENIKSNGFMSNGYDVSVLSCDLPQLRFALPAEERGNVLERSVF